MPDQPEIYNPETEPFQRDQVMEGHTYDGIQEYENPLPFWWIALFGISILFAIVHVQYGFLTPATLALFIIGFSLGIIRRQHNTTLAVFVHFGYDFSLGLIALLIANFDPAAEIGAIICRCIFVLL